MVKELARYFTVASGVCRVWRGTTCKLRHIEQDIEMNTEMNTEMNIAVHLLIDLERCLFFDGVQLHRGRIEVTFAQQRNYR